LEYWLNIEGEKYVYDVNTNYNQKAEIEAGGKKQGMQQIANFLTEKLNNL
jgi:hypothetical protein